MSFFETHRALLDQAVAACRTRGYWSAYPEIASGKIYGETAKADGEAAFKALLGKPFDLGQPGGKTVGQEVSPYGMPLGITYAAADVATLIKASSDGRREMGRGLDRGSRRRLSRNRRAHQQAKLPARQCRDAHHRAGLHDGVPGRRPACAGSRAGSDRLRL